MGKVVHRDFLASTNCALKWTTTDPLQTRTHTEKPPFKFDAITNASSTGTCKLLHDEKQAL